MKKENKVFEILAFIGRLLAMLKTLLNFRKSRKPQTDKPASEEEND